MSPRYVNHRLIVVGILSVLIAALSPNVPQAAGGLALRVSLLNTPVLVDRTAVSTDTGLTQMSVALGSPLYLRIELINESSQPIVVMPSVHPATGLVRLYIVGPDGKPTMFTTQRWEVGDRFLAPQALPPGKRVTHETFLYGKLADSTAGGIDYLFPASGTYQLFARYNWPDASMTVESNHVTVRVGAPIPRWAELKQAGIVPCFEGISGSEEESSKRREQLKGLMGAAPNKALAPWFETPAEKEAQKAPRLALESQTSIEQAFGAFIASWAAGDLAGCTKHLAGDFQYNSARDRTQFGELLDEGLQQLRAGGATPRISTEDAAVTTRGDTVEVTCRLIMSNDKAGTLGEQQIKLQFTSQNNTWLISRWNRLEP